MDWLTLGWVRNDLAMTQYQLGRPADCLATLEPLSADAAMTEEEARERYLPGDWENYEPIVMETRANIALCTRRQKQ